MRSFDLAGGGFICAKCHRANAPEVAVAGQMWGILRFLDSCSPEVAPRMMVSPEKFVMVYMDTPIEICEQRDVKGLYARARTAMAEGHPMGFTGVDDPYEPPIDPEITLPGFGPTPEENARQIIAYLEEKGFLLPQ